MAPWRLGPRDARDGFVCHNVHGLSEYPAGVMVRAIGVEAVQLLKLISSILRASDTICDCGVAGRTKASVSAREEGLKIM